MQAPADVLSTFSHGTIPITNERSVNETSACLGGFYISYNRSSAGYGCPTTAIVIDHHVHFILKGDHKAALAAASQVGGLGACIDYFIEHIDQASSFSEHLNVIGCDADLFGLRRVALEALGQPVLDRIAQAVRSL